MKCCDTCRQFVLESEPNEAGKRWGHCTAKLPPWAEIMVSIGGREMTKTQAESGATCPLHEPSYMSLSATRS